MAPPPRLRILSGKFFTPTAFFKKNGPAKEGVCSGWQCNFSLSVMATAGNNLLRRDLGVEIRV